MASALRFISNCRRKANGEPIEALKPTANQSSHIIIKMQSVRVPLKQSEYQRAETLLFRSTQNDAFGDEIKTLQKNLHLDPSKWFSLERNSPLYKLTPLLDNEMVLRVDGRCDKAEHLPFDMRFPVILPGDGAVTELLVRHYHQTFGHGFRETVKNEIKQRFYIFNLTSSVLVKVERSCVWCKIHKNLRKFPEWLLFPYNAYAIQATLHICRD